MLPNWDGTSNPSDDSFKPTLASKMDLFGVTFRSVDGRGRLYFPEVTAPAHDTSTYQTPILCGPKVTTEWVQA